jgi:hypothetical protein
MFIFSLMKQRFLISLILILLGSGVSGQEVLRRFSTDLENFPGELVTFMGTSEEETQPMIIQTFLENWNTGMMMDTTKAQLIAISNKLLDKKARPRPHFVTFLQVINAFTLYLGPADNYLNWLQSVQYMTSSRDYALPVINDYFLFSLKLLNSGILYESNSTRWTSSNPDFQLIFDDSVRVVLGKTDLTCNAVRDSILIYGTSGIYNPISHLWRGEGGKATWERAGYAGDQVFAELEKYRVNFRVYEFHADSVSFYHKQYFDFAMLGSLDFKVERIISEATANYPRFESYQGSFQLDDIIEDIDYYGGISMYGSKMIGSGSSDEKAILNFFKNDTLVIVAHAENFVFDREKITSNEAEISLYMGNDSIYHPSIGINYIVDENRFSTGRNSNFQSQSPYYNSFHHVEMNFEQLSWKLNEKLIELKIREGGASGLANFQSNNLYDAYTYFRLQGIDDENPLVLLRRYSEQVFDISFYGTEFARFAHMRPTHAEQLLKQMAQLGFITYDLEEDRVTMRQKTYDWIYASVDYIDYDVINFVSETEAPLENGSLDLNNYDLHINGVKEIQLSSAQAVTIFPANRQITMKKNRDFVFDGVMDAGLFTFYGRNFYFNYDTFKINLNNIDSLSLKVKTEVLDAYGRVSVLDISSMLEDMTGELLIDDPENKSGRKKLPSYPVFSSTENSFIYYDDLAIQNGVYKRKNFYFEVYPFSIDSLDNFSEISLKLDGILRSADIFPAIEETLHVQKDNSLGFRYMTDSSGLEIYGGKGHYYDSIMLSNAGLRGSGHFNYLTSRGTAGDIVFHPDSMFTNASTFEIQQQQTGVQYPLVTSTMNDLKWYPYRDTMIIEEGTNPFVILNDTTALSGTLALTPQGLSGSGRMELTNSVLFSDHFSYTASIFDADTAEFRLKSVNTDGYTLITDNINAHVDFENLSGLFKTNEDFSLVEFPENKYVSRLDLFRWDMDRTELEMGSASAMDTIADIVTDEYGEDIMVGPRYISIDREQDSLSFVSNRATYDYSRNILRGSNVTFLRVADAYIYPGDGQVIIDPNGVMEELTEASIIANREQKEHRFYNATVQVLGQFNYTGSGYSDYVSETGEPQSIYFHEISVDDSVNTVALGIVGKDQYFTLSPYFYFQGNVELDARKTFLTFNGGASIIHDCPCNEDTYLKFRAEIDPAFVYIPIPEQAFDIDMNYTYAGLFLAGDSVHIYPTFLSRKRLPRDQYIITSSGVLYYDRQSGEYRISSREKLRHPERVPGNLLRLSRSDCVIYGEGKIRLGLVPGQVRIASVGNVVHNMNTDETELNVTLAMNYFMSEDAFEIMAGEIDGKQDLNPVDLADPLYVKNLTELIGSERTEKYQTELGLYGAYQSSVPELKHTLFFTNVKLVWNLQSRSYRSVGKIFLGSINGDQVNKQLDGYIELTKRRNGDLVDIYLELDRRNWYYFGYTRGVMSVLSSNSEFNTAVEEVKTSQRKMNTPRDEVQYLYVLSDPRKKAMFIRRMQEGDGAPVE